MSQQARVTEVFDRFAGEAWESLQQERGPALDNRGFVWRATACMLQARKSL